MSHNYASANPAVLTLAEADAELQRLTLLRKNHLADQDTATVHAGDPVTIGSRGYAREDAPGVLGKLCWGTSASPAAYRSVTTAACASA